jgi:hypothetical protein
MTPDHHLDVWDRGFEDGLRAGLLIGSLAGLAVGIMAGLLVAGVLAA